MIAWMPTNLAPTPEAASELLVRMVGDAFDCGLPAAGLGGRYRYDPPGSPTPVQPGSGLTTASARYLIHIHPCQLPTFRFFVAVGHSPQQPQLVAAPEFVGGGTAYLFRFARSGGSGLIIEDRSGFPPVRRAVYPFFEALLEASRLLPSWVFIYAAPLDVSLRDLVADRIVFLQTPLVLNSGRVLPFVQGHERPVPASAPTTR